MEKTTLCALGIVFGFLAGLALGMLYGVAILHPAADTSLCPVTIKEVPTTRTIQKVIEKPIIVEKNVTKYMTIESEHFCPWLGPYDCKTGGTGSRAYVEKQCSDGTMIKYNCSNGQLYDGEWPQPWKDDS